MIEKSPIILFSPEEASNYETSQETGLPFYITANLTPEQANRSFIVGDKKIYNGYYNAPLMEKREYEVLVGTVSSLNGVGWFKFFPLTIGDNYKISFRSILRVVHRTNGNITLMFFTYKNFIS